MEPWMALPVGLILVVALAGLRKSDTRLGKAIRDSDHAAWRIAMEEKEWELEQLRRAEPRED